MGKQRQTASGNIKGFHSRWVVGLKIGRHGNRRADTVRVGQANWRAELVVSRCPVI